MLRGKLYIGTSGFSYSHWENDVFYPKKLQRSKQLEYYSRYFNTVEMNYPFYRLPSIKSFTHWKKTVPKGFIFAIKVSRYITHIKHFRQIKTAWKTFLKRALYLEDKLGPFLFQLPSNRKKDLKMLREFTEMIKETDLKYRFVFEFRHISWFTEDVYKNFKKQKNISLCLADSPQWPFREIITGNFVYIRMHGGKALYTSNYSEKELKNLSERIKKYLKQGLTTFVYFNNDAMGFAVKNAKILNRLLR